MDNHQDLPLYYQYTNNLYEPTEAEIDFHNAGTLDAFGKEALGK